MPDEKDLLKPTASAAPEPEIHVIPEKFYGAALKQKVGKLPPPPADPKTPEPPKPPESAVPGAPPKKKKFPILLVIIPLILIAGGVGAYFLFLKPKPKPVVETPPVNTAPKGPVCGDGKCEEPETTASCAADCKPPAPVCGDTKCDAGETPESCTFDCKPVGPVCGDNKCEAPTETTESCLADCKPPEPVPGVDSDSDGLTDEEEKTVFGTKSDNPNTDRDSFVDLNEALNLFDPAKPSPSMLSDNPGFTLYRDEALGFELLRPSGWTVKTDSEDAAATFTSQGGEFVVAAVVSTRTEGQSLMDWYLAQSPGVTSSQVEPYRTRQGYEAIASPDRFTIYVDGVDKVFVITYNLGPRAEVQYKVTFQAMVQSLKLLP